MEHTTSTLRFGTVVALVAVVVGAALAVPALAGATVRSFVSTRCSVAPGTNSRFDSATSAVSFNYPYVGGSTAAYADAAAHAAGALAQADTNSAQPNDDCTTDSLFTDTLTVGAGTTGLAPGTPVTLRLTTNVSGGIDGGGKFLDVPYLASVDMFASYTLTGTRLVCGVEGCGLPKLARLGFDARRVLTASAGSSSDPDGSITDNLRWSWDLVSNAAAGQGDSASSYGEVCPTFPTTCVTGVPGLGVGQFVVPVGSRSIEFRTEVGAQVAIEGRLNVLSQTFGPSFALGDLLHTLTAEISPGAGYEGLDLSYASRPAGPPPDTTPPEVDCATPADVWHAGNVSISCTASDSGSGLQSAADAAFTLDTSVPVGVEDANAQTGSHQVCDVAGNCATAGPVGGIKVDRKAPTLSIPPNVVVDATSPFWADVTLVSATAVDGGSGVQTITCPVGTSGFPLGTTTVGCVAYDAVGNQSVGSYTVTVRDVDGPKLSLPSNLVVNATSPAGAAVTYSASADDVGAPPATISCSPPSGSTFAIGQTTVSCTATDSLGNPSTGSFTVTVKGAKEQLADLIQKVVYASSLPPSAKTLLIGKLNQLLAHFDPLTPTQRQALCLALQVFKEAVQLQAGKTITQAQAAEWVADANRIRAVLGC
jgi:hypothetical protein